MYQFENEKIFKPMGAIGGGDMLNLLAWLLTDKIRRDGIASIPPELARFIEEAPASEGFKR